MIVTYFLALVLVFDLSTKAPTVVAPFASKEQCMIAAEDRNREATEDMKKKGAGYVCLKLEYPGEV